MANRINRIYSIKYPFTHNNEDGRFIDVNDTLDQKIASEIAYVILTQKGTRLRRPDFGTNLIKYIFEDNMSDVWDDIKNEIITAVSSYVPNVSIVDVGVYNDEMDDNSMYLNVKYQVVKGNSVEYKELTTKI
jgi:phage baseplate assembly protein W